MAKNKTISLDDYTAEIADKMPNFSRFVRQCLLKHARSATSELPMQDKDDHVAPKSARVWGEDRNKCNPKHQKGVCPTCWGVE